MKIALFALVMVLGSGSAFAAECPDFSGVFASDDIAGVTGCEMTIKQTGCRLVEYQFSCKNPPIAVSDVMVADGIFRAENQAPTSPSEGLATVSLSMTAYRFTSTALAQNIVSSVVNKKDGTAEQSSTTVELTLDANQDIVSTSQSYDALGKLKGASVLNKLKRIK